MSLSMKYDRRGDQRKGLTGPRRDNRTSLPACHRDAYTPFPNRLDYLPGLWPAVHTREPGRLLHSP